MICCERSLKMKKSSLQKLLLNQNFKLMRPVGFRFEPDAVLNFISVG
jgi:hypothetical protein